ncbi:MAG: glycerophosphodiester phosphodiesterase [Promethearchaeota archaeon]
MKKKIRSHVSQLSENTGENKPTLILISGHRGYHDKETDNTAKAFQRAIDEGLDYIEFDVRKTSDNIPIVFHDRTLNSLTNGKGAIEKYSLKELRKIRYKDGQELQTLEEMFEQFAGKINFMLEIKSDNIERQIMELIKKYGIESQTLIQSFSILRVHKAHKIYPHSQLKWGLCMAFLGNLGKIGKITGLNKIISTFIFNFNIRPFIKYLRYLNLDGPFICDEFISYVKKYDLNVILGAMQTDKYLKNLKKWNVKIINANNPAYIVKLIRTKYPNKYVFSKSLKI